MKGRATALLILLLLAAAVPVGIASLRSRPSAETPPTPRKTPHLPTSAVPDPSPKAGAEEPPAASEESAATSWLRVTLDVPDPKSSYSFEARVFDLQTGFEQTVDHSNVDHFDIGPLKPGRKGVLLFSPQGSFCPLGAVVTVPENRDAELLLRPQRSVLLEGVVVDASGEGVFGIDLEFSVVVPLGNALPEKESQMFGFAGATGRGGGSGRSRYRGSSSSYSALLNADHVDLTESVSTDSNGHFQLRLYSGPSAVSLRLKSGDGVIKEESVLPSRSPLRLIVPVLPEPSKK